MKIGGGIDILSHDVSITPDLKTGYIRGTETITLRVAADGPKIITFSHNPMKILLASSNGDALQPVSGKTHSFILPALGSSTPLTLDFAYEGQPKKTYGVKSGTIYTGYFACEWMLCRQDIFGDKAHMTLEINLPRQMDTLGPGTLLKYGVSSDDRYTALWKTDAAYAPYLYAFAVGKFESVIDTQDGITLNYVSAVTTAKHLTDLFEPTRDMLVFFQSKAGVPFPRKTYTQLYVEGGAAQEAISHSIIGSRMLKPILTDPKEDWVIAHELAHQWWGNSLTCSDISEFWLNEGFVTFMVAAWKEHKWGRDAYVREMDLLRARYGRVQEAGLDYPLSFDGKYPDIRTRRAIQYSKGALFMDALREELGDDAFWSSLAAYTQTYMGRTVTSRDFQKAFEETTGRDLSPLFDAWVY